MATILSDFKVFKTNFPKILELSGYRMDYLVERIGLSASVFSNKKKRNYFEIDEMEKLMRIVQNDYLEEKFLAQAMIDGRGRVIYQRKKQKNYFRMEVIADKSFERDFRKLPHEIKKQITKVYQEMIKA